jgi:hypothetical protein
MKKLIKIFAVIFICTQFLPKLSSAQNSCGNWSRDAGSFISMRQCVQYGYKNHQFYNGYSFAVHFWVVLTATDGSTTGQDFGSGFYVNLYLDPNQISDNAANDFPSGVNKDIAGWQITRKQRQNSNGTWVDF